MFNEKQHLHRPFGLLVSFSCVLATLHLYAADPLPLPVSDAPDNTAGTPAFRISGDQPVYAAAGTSSVPQPAPVQVSSSTQAPSPTPAPVISDPPPLFEKSIPAPSAAPSQNVTINLINRLVERNVLSKEDAADLIKQAEQDAVVARNQAVQDAVVAAKAQAPDAAPEDAVRVTYVPEVVKAQMRDEIKQEVMAQARSENWAAPRTFPDWVSHFRFFGDIRVRYEGDNYPDGNDNTGGFPNFNAINTGSPFDKAGNNYPPEYDVDQNRTRFRLRARMGADIDLGDGFTAGMRIATGNDDNPVTENQTIGGANSGQGGDFSKYAIWLDRAFIKYELGGLPNKDFSVTVGRFNNPFFSTSMIWADEIGFDGVVAQGRYEVVKGLTPFVTAGAFPVFNTDFNFASNQPAKFTSEDKYLYAVQGGADWKINDDFNAKFAAAYYDYENVEGKLSSPFTPLSAADQGNTDDTRPSFAQNGNTYMQLRDIVPTASNDFGNSNQFQYYGLATPFREVALTGRLDFNHFDPFHISLTAEWVTNIAFDRNSVANQAVNNLSPNTNTFAGSNNGWLVNMQLGKAKLENRWDWNAGIGYRYVESDAVVDGFTDADFGSPLTGTNLKGYTLFGALALSPKVWLYLRWMSATSIAGPTYKNDIIQVDVNTKF